MKKSGVAGKVRVVDDIHEISKIMMRCVVGVTYQLKVEKEIHDWPFFVIGAVMDSLTDEFPWTMMFLDNTVVRVRSWWKKFWRGGGMVWRVEEWKSVEPRPDTCL